MYLIHEFECFTVHGEEFMFYQGWIHKSFVTHTLEANRVNTFLSLTLQPLGWLIIEHWYNREIILEIKFNITGQKNDVNKPVECNMMLTKSYVRDNDVNIRVECNMMLTKHGKYTKRYVREISPSYVLWQIERKKGRFCLHDIQTNCERKIICDAYV